MKDEDATVASSEPDPCLDVLHKCGAEPLRGETAADAIERAVRDVVVGPRVERRSATSSARTAHMSPSLMTSLTSGTRRSRVNTLSKP